MNVLVESEQRALGSVPEGDAGSDFLQQTQAGTLLCEKELECPPSSTPESLTRVVGQQAQQPPALAGHTAALAASLRVPDSALRSPGNRGSCSSRPFVN